jgi:hypothetical protein
MKIIVSCFVLMSVVAIAFADRAEPYWTCENADTARQVNECRGRCRSTSDAKLPACDDAYHQCVSGCAQGDTFHDCRNGCRDNFDRCHQDIAREMDRCANACVTDAGCSL